MSRLNVDKITGKTGTNSGAPITLSGDTATFGSGITFPDKIRDRTEWYPLHNEDNYHGTYLTSNNLDEGTARCSGCAPAGFTAVTGIKLYFVSGSSDDPGNWGTGGSAMTITWNIGADTEAHNAHSKAISITDNTTFGGTNKIRTVDIFNRANDGTDFEDLISENDVFGIQVDGPNTSGAFFGLGAKITWRF